MAIMAKAHKTFEKKMRKNISKIKILCYKLKINKSGIDIGSIGLGWVCQ